MRTYMIYLLLTGKRLLRQLPYFLAGLYEPASHDLVSG